MERPAGLEVLTCCSVLLELFVGAPGFGGRVLESRKEEWWRSGAKRRFVAFTMILLQRNTLSGQTRIWALNLEDYYRLK